MVIPLTSQEKNGSYYFSFLDNTKNKSWAIFSQMRYIDGSRIGEKVGYISKKTFKNIEDGLIDFIKNIPT